MTAYASSDCRRQFAMLAICLVASLTGCHAVDFYTTSINAPMPPEQAPPRELSMVSLPAYRIEPPDVLRLEAVKLVPRPPYRISPRDVLMIRAIGTFPDQPIDGYYLVEDDGIVTLGPAYGVVSVAGMLLEEAVDAVTRHLQTTLQAPHVFIQLGRLAYTEQLNNVPYPVHLDGTINLGRYGMVRVAGRTVTEVREALERHLGQYFDSPQISVDVIDYRSKTYYVILGTGMVLGARTPTPAQTNQKLPFTITGNETVLDALAELGQMSSVSSKVMWLVRPKPGKDCGQEILPIDWAAISRGGMTDTNYQIMPGDRLYIVDDNIANANRYLATLTNPIEAILNITTLGADTVRTAQTMGRSYNQQRDGF
jgi:polysaccharide biosynthesis/export protein